MTVKPWPLGAHPSVQQNGTVQGAKLQQAHGHNSLCKQAARKAEIHISLTHALM